jgi:hypothetical protein
MRVQNVDHPCLHSDRDQVHRREQACLVFARESSLGSDHSARWNNRTPDLAWRTFPGVYTGERRMDSFDATRMDGCGMSSTFTLDIPGGPGYIRFTNPTWQNSSHRAWRALGTHMGAFLVDTKQL